MTFAWLVIAALGLSGMAASSAGTIDANDRESLQGKWSVVSAERDGQEAKDIVGNQLVVEGDAFTVRAQDQTIYEGTVSLNPAPDPRAIDFKHTGGSQKGKTWQGIYKFAGEILTICDNAADIQKERPSGFDTKPGSGRVLVVFKRDKPSGRTAGGKGS